jgi:hypothetical protein
MWESLHWLCDASTRFIHRHTYSQSSQNSTTMDDNSINKQYGDVTLPLLVLKESPVCT